ncbi:hypothetical protein [Wolinella succinogenes]|uniref:hypothetical protein n=1 Tax=Wolinella succinogenes TaxID=844 RepID=UPI00240A5B24|nr:hypothetical protein [Wolinella succinogenes]
MRRIFTAALVILLASGCATSGEPSGGAEASFCEGVGDCVGKSAMFSLAVLALVGAIPGAAIGYTVEKISDGIKGEKSEEGDLAKEVGAEESNESNVSSSNSAFDLEARPHESL